MSTAVCSTCFCCDGRGAHDALSVQQDGRVDHVSHRLTRPVADQVLQRKYTFNIFSCCD